MLENKVFIRGNRDCPEKVIEALKKYGGRNLYAAHGSDTDAIYFLSDTPKDAIVYASVRDMWGELITTHPDWTEIFPE